MPTRRKSKCSMCNTTSSSVWRKGEDKKVLCNNCFLVPVSTSTSVKNDANTINNSNVEININVTNDNKELSDAIVNSDLIAINETIVKTEEEGCGFNFRKSTRAKSSRYRPGQLKSNNPKFKSRRNIFKKVCMKAPTAVSTPITSESLFFKGHYYQVGDVVSCVDFKNKVYYAQIRGLLQDQYAQKSAVITWLLPTIHSPADRFDPATYMVGPDEDIPRKLECFEFVCHAPSEYFKAKTSPYPVLPTKPESGFIWTTMGPRILSLEQKFGKRL